MKKGKCLKILLLLTIIAVMSIGCSVYRGQSFWEVSQTKIDLEAKNFKVRKLGAQGNASCPYLFGLPLGGSAVCGIPLSNQDVQSKAMWNIHENWDGEGACFFHNINVEWTNYGIPAILLWHQYTVTADIYEFDDEYVDYATRKR